MTVKLEHSRQKVLARLLTLQVLPATLLLLLLPIGPRFFEMNASNQVLVFISGVGLLTFYFVFSVLAVLKLRKPDYLVVSKDGQGEWTPFFGRRELRFEPGASLVLRDSKILITPPALAIGRGGDATPMSEMPLPKTVSAAADKLTL